MLILMRRPRERIRIGNDVIVTVLQIDRNRVVLGIEAPQNVVVNREEIHEAIQREQRDSTLQGASRPIVPK